MTDSSGNQIGAAVKYLPFGEARSAIDIPVDKLFTGQRLDATGLYYYNARYYDPMIGRFISADPVIQILDGLQYVSFQLCINYLPFLTVMPKSQLSYPLLVFSAPLNPQSANRYSYVLNDPLIYIDSTGFVNWWLLGAGIVLLAVGGVVAWYIVPVALAAIPTEFAAAETSLEFNAAVGAIGDLSAVAGASCLPAVTGAGLIYLGFGSTDTSSSNHPYYHQVTFADNSIGFFTNSQINQMQQAGVQLSVNGNSQYVIVTFSDGSVGYFTPEQVDAMQQMGVPVSTS
jgi:RHS repeat-associated protein